MSGIYNAFEDVSGRKSVCSSPLDFDSSRKMVMGWGRIAAEQGLDGRSPTYLNKVQDTMPPKATRYARRILKRIFKARVSQDG